MKNGKNHGRPSCGSGINIPGRWRIGDCAACGKEDIRFIFKEIEAMF